MKQEEESRGSKQRESNTLEETRRAAAADRCPSHVHTYKAAVFCSQDLWEGFTRIREAAGQIWTGQMKRVALHSLSKRSVKLRLFFFFFLILHPTKRSQQEHCTCDGKAADVGSDSVTTCWDTRKQLKQEKKNPNLQEAGFCVKKLCFAALLMCSSAPPSVKRTHRAAAPYTLMTDWEQNTETCDVTRCKFL